MGAIFVRNPLRLIDENTQMTRLSAALQLHFHQLKAAHGSDPFRDFLDAIKSESHRSNRLVPDTSPAGEQAGELLRHVFLRSFLRSQLNFPPSQANVP
jgi:hypothetical protein